MSGILPTRFDPTTRWEDTSASKWNAWLEATKTNTAKVQTLWGLVRQLMRRRLVAGEVAAPGFRVAHAVVAPIATWFNRRSGDAIFGQRAELRDGVVWGTGDAFEIGKFYDVRRTPFDRKAPGDGFFYTYDESGLARESKSVANPEDIERQDVTPGYYTGEVITIAKMSTLIPVGETEEPVVWQELNARRWGKELGDA